MTTPKNCLRRNSRRGGIILLVVLGMLTLFSTLAASYLVFTNSQRRAAISISRAEKSGGNPQDFLDEALKQILVGDVSPASSVWGHDLLGDLYGMRDAVRGEMPAALSQWAASNNRIRPDVLLSGEFIRIPTRVHQTAVYTDRRLDIRAERRYPATAATQFDTDEELVGRILTFEEGPLEDLSMRIVRSFGDHSGATNSRSILSGQIVLDIRPHLGKSISVEALGETNTLGEWVRLHRLPTSDSNRRDISYLFYPDVPTTTATQTPLSNFVINGRVLNGPGLGWDVPRDNALVSTSTTYNLNDTISTDYRPTPIVPPSSSGGANDVRIDSAFEASDSGQDVPSALQGNYALYRSDPAVVAGTAAAAYVQDLPPGDSDEPYDAPDEQNWFLSYFPGAPEAAGDPVLGADTPSFVRLGVLNWILNQHPTFAADGIDSLSINRVRQILRALQRATLRPLRIENDPTMPAMLTQRAEGVMQLDYSNFTGSNASDLGIQPIDFAETDPAVLAQQIRDVIGALATGDWDVDNNGDGVPDGVWIDAGLGITEDETGRVVKPLVSYLVEDLSGRVDVNLSGNLAQALQSGGAFNRIVKSSEGYLWDNGAAPMGSRTESNLANGFGYGPAEIDLRPLFFDPIKTGTPSRVSSMVGNGSLGLLSQRLVRQRVSGVDYVASGFLVDRRTRSGNDLPGVLLQPDMPNLHTGFGGYGMPVDKFGRGSIALGTNGDLLISGLSASVRGGGSSAGDANDDPYEMVRDANGLPDSAFSLTDLEAILRLDDFDRDSLNSELVQLMNEHFDDPGTAVAPTTVPPTAQDINIARRRFANSVTTISNTSATANGVLPQEYRDGATSTPNGPSAPQSLLTEEVASGAISDERRNALLMQLLPREILAGKKLNLNRPFGNGLDDDNDGVVDDPQELRSVAQEFYETFASSNAETVYTTQYADVTNGIPGPGTGRYEPTPQELFARHLYVMAMTLIRDNVAGVDFDFTGGSGGIIALSEQAAIDVDPDPSVTTYGAASVEQEYRALRIAQWAINVADFRDPDAIMSRFRYDIDPFDGWQIETVTVPMPAPSRLLPTFRTVWGMEYPELTLEESIALHDRRVRDTKLDSTLTERWDGTDFDDPDMDQYRIPQGSLYLELRSSRSPDQLQINPANDADDVAAALGVPLGLYGFLDIDNSMGLSAGDEYALDLARRAPDRNPVWRVAITRAHPGVETVGATDAELSADEMLQPVGSESATNPYTLPPGNLPVTRLRATLDPLQPDVFGSSIPDAIDRVIWFTNENPDNGIAGDGTASDGVIDFAPADSQDAGRVFYNRFQESDYPYQDTSPGDTDVEVYLRGGQYAVIGPRVLTHVGSLQEHSGSGTTHDSTTDEPLVPYADYESPQRFILSSNNFSHRLISDARSTPTIDDGSTANASIRRPLGIVAAANAPAMWTGPPIAPDAVIAAPNNVGLGLSVSEPLNLGNYYSNPTQQLKAGFPNDSYYNYDTSAGAFPNEPFDEAATSELFEVFGVSGSKTGTRDRFKTAYLQRLADPTQPYDAIANPYRSVDYITIDLTVFNGSEEVGPNGNREETNAALVTEWIDVNNEEPFASDPPEAFASRYKSGQSIFTAATAGNVENLSFSVNTFPPAATSTAPAATAGHTAIFNRSLSLQDQVNPDVTTTPPPPLATAADAHPIPTVHSTTLGYANASHGGRTRRAGTLTGVEFYSTGQPFNNSFSGLVWLNRPLVSPLELAWVPSTSAAGFNANFGTPVVPPGYLASDFYAGTGGGAGDRPEHRQIFPHLFNFYSSDPDYANTPNLWRILDWVDVPATFDFEHDFLLTNNDPYSRIPNPPNASPPPALIPETAGVDHPGESVFGDVFNYNSFGTAPVTGNPDSWTNATAAFWLNRWVEESFRAPFNVLAPDYRQGKINLNTIKTPRVYQALMSGIADTSPSPPTQPFLDVFIRSRRGYDPTAVGAQGVDSIGPNFHREHPTQFVQAYRSTSVGDLSPVASGRGIEPIQKSLLRSDPVTPTQPLLVEDLAGADVRSLWAQRSVLHQQLPTTRLSNLATDQSNVFAVWVTVGLFEVDVTNNGVGKEVGIDDGTVQRYKAFHIIDRSVPVRYEPGVLHNALETVRLSRTLN